MVMHNKFPKFVRQEFLFLIVSSETYQILVTTILFRSSYDVAFFAKVVEGLIK